MKYLKIKNNGLLDVRLIALMGGTTKASSQFKIGQFGTGLKYTLAYLFRNNIAFRVFVGDKEVKITLEHEDIAGTKFSIICIDGQRTSITTQMGADWEPWMIVRELYSNALDEGGAEHSIVERASGKDGCTSFYIELTPEFMEVYNGWDEYFIVGKQPFYEDEGIKIFPQSGPLKVYKQGILINQLKENSLCNYDIKTAHINELREYKGFLEGDLVDIIFNITDKKVIQYFVENMKEDHYEAKIDYDYEWAAGKFSKEWEEALEGVKIIHPEAKKAIEARGIEIDTAATITVPKNLYKGLSKQFEGIGALRVSKEVNDFYEIYNEGLHDKVKKAQELLEQADYYINPELSFIYGVFGDKTVLAKVSLDDKKIYMSEKHLGSDLFSICATLIEENEHFKTGMRDETREFQQHFIDLYANAILDKASVDILG